MAIEIVTVAARPDLVAVAAGWLWREWSQPRGGTLERVTAAVAGRLAEAGPELTVVLLDDGVPAGTASLVHDDLDPRPDLTPWLASVYVDPRFRGRGHAPRLVREIEARAARGGVRLLHLYSYTAVPLYARLGWEAFGEAMDGAQKVTLMRKALAAPA